MYRILIVEDNADLAEGLAVNLQIEGFEPSVATNASQALALAERLKPALVVLDIGLPDRSGFEVLQDLRARGHWGPVLILSARAMEADKVMGFRLGADDYVTKPFGVVELLARVRALLRRAALAEETNPPVQVSTDVDSVLRDRFGLTDRQVVVAHLIAEGHTNADIARELGISPFTARNHTEQVLGKLGAGTRARVGAIIRTL